MEAKQRNGGTGNRRRRDRAARMQKRQQRQCAAAEEASENDESPPVRQKRPPTRKKRIKEPIFQEDIVDGFAFLCFKTYEDLERTVTKYEKKASPEEGGEASGGERAPDHPPVLEESLPQLDKKPNTLPKVKKKNRHLNHKVGNNIKESSLIKDESSRPGEEILETPRSTSRDQLSDASSHASLERGYLCDSESGDERGSEPECDLFSNKNDNNFIAKKNNPGHSQNCRSPPVLPPIHPVQNGTHHPEPSTAVAAVTASTSPANTSSAMVVGATSPREPQIGSPAVIPVSCPSPASPSSGTVRDPSPSYMPTAPPLFLNSKDSASSSKLLNNGYEFVSDTSPPSPAPAAKLLSPNKFLHKRVPPVPSCRENVAALSKPAINVYDFVSDHETPSSPDGVIFLSQSKFHHKGIPPPVATNSKDATTDKLGVSNGHITNLAPSPPVLSAPVIQTSHKSALDMSLKSSVTKTEQPPPSILPPAAAGDLRLQASPGQSRSSYGIPYSTSQPVRKVSASPGAAMLTIPSSPAPSVPVVSPAPATTRTTVSTSVTMSSSTASHVLATRSRSPAVTASHSNTPTPVPARDTHSSHSNSSLSSLSQLSTPVHKEREGGGSRSHSNSSNVAPPISAALTSASAYASASSLAGLVFSKPQCWSGHSNTTNTLSTSTTRSSPAPPRASPALSSAGMPLPPTLPPAHHTSPFGGSHSGPPPPPLLPVASHHAIFNPSSLTPTLPLEATAGPSPYRAETLFPQPSEYKKHPDLLRRELDTRFLASQDHSIPIPPPPYMQSEVQHHSQMHQQGPFMAPPPLGAPMVSQPGAHLYEKYPKLDSSLYRRPSIGLSGYPGVSSLFAPGGGGASTPFVPPAHLAALQPKINSVSKTKSMKPGKWCAMHVRIAWEIYNHQQKHKAEAHKAGIALASVKPPSEHHLAANHLFCSLPRQHELSPFSSSLLSAGMAPHPRTFDHSSHHSTFLNPTPAHLGPFARPGYPSFAGAAPGFTGLGPIGIPGPAMLGADLRLSQDPWTQRTTLPFAGGSPWGGLKEEAERDRLQQERKREEERQKRAEQERREKEERERREQERREQEKRELERQEQERKEQERREKERREQERRRELERREMERREQDRREQERREQERQQKERDRELRFHHQLQKSSIVMNGEIRDHHLHHAPHHHPHHHAAAVAAAREWERANRSPATAVASVKYEGTLERHAYPQPVKIKQERKEEEPTSRSIRPPGEERSRKRPPAEDPVSLVSSRSVAHNSLGLGPHGLIPSPAKDPLAHHSQTSPLWGPLTPSPTVTTLPGSAMDPYRTREMLQARSEHDARRFETLVMSQRDSELSRQISNALDMERATVAAYDRAKLLPPPLRTNESPYATPPTLPPASASSFFSPPVSPYLCSASGRTKSGPPGMLNGLPPPLIPCTFPVVQNHAGFPAARTSSPMAPHKLLPGTLNLPDSYFSKDRREVNGHPSDFDAHLRL